MDTVSWKIPVGGDEISAVYEPGTDERVLFVCAHGAGGNMNDRGMLKTANALRSRRLGIVRFNFPYSERKSKRPDPMPRLKDSITAVVARVRQELEPRTLVIGGRSMGGRVASMLAADEFSCDGLLLLAYPLHPAGLPDKLRDAHLPSITVPVLCINGTRDALCRRDLMDNALKTVKTDWEMHWVEGADHSFHVLKSSGRTDAEVLDEIGDISQKWSLRLRPQ
ncbi:MAG: alpha/beta fold hydrolase [Gemmatimonadaceae bacterium]